MNTALLDVLDFHKTMGLSIGDPRKPDVDIDTQLRWDLIKEEFDELTLALEGKGLSEEGRIIAVADALGDICYTVIGAAVSWGIDLGSVFSAIHASNMTKSLDSKTKAGKVKKGANYVPPDIKGALQVGKEEIEENGFGEDCWWPCPTVCSGITEKVPSKTRADLKKVLKTIKADFVNGWKEPTENLSFGDNSLPPELSEKLLTQTEPRDTKPTATTVENFQKGYFSAQHYIFDCQKCKRTHTVSLHKGSRGGFADSGSCECMCGMAFEFAFSFQGTDLVARGNALDLSEGH